MHFSHVIINEIAISPTNKVGWVRLGDQLSRQVYFLINYAFWNNFDSQKSCTESSHIPFALFPLMITSLYNHGKFIKRN